jgi:hypothetical protein
LDFSLRDGRNGFEEFLSNNATEIDLSLARESQRKGKEGRGGRSGRGLMGGDEEAEDFGDSETTASFTFTGKYAINAAFQCSFVLLNAIRLNE